MIICIHNTRTISSYESAPTISFNFKKNEYYIMLMFNITVFDARSVFL